MVILTLSLRFCSTSKKYYKTRAKVPNVLWISYFLHTVSSQSRFFENYSEKTPVARTRVQTVAFWAWNFDFESCFIAPFESTTKPQREAQKYHLEHTIATLSRRLQLFSKRTHKKYKTAVFWGQGYPRPDPLDKNRGLENTCALHPKESTILSQKRFKCGQGGGHAWKPRKRSV